MAKSNGGGGGTVASAKTTAARRTRTTAVRGGLRRTNYQETSEALFLNSGYVYDSAEEAAEAFAHPTPERYVYSRYANPTVSMF